MQVNSIMNKTGRILFSIFIVMLIILAGLAASNGINAAIWQASIVTQGQLAREMGVVFFIVVVAGGFVFLKWIWGQK